MEQGESTGQTGPWRWPPPLVLVWLVVPVAALVLRLAFAPINPHDYWWTLAMGRMIAETGVLPESNLFLYTLPADAPFVDQPWLAQWLLYTLYQAGGHAGPFVVRSIVGAATWTGLLWAACRRGADPRVAGGFALLGVVLSASLFAVRTQLFALPLYAATLYILLAVPEGRIDRRWMLALVPIVAIWGNLHGSFILGPVLVGIVAGARVVEEVFASEEAGSVGLARWLVLLVAVVLAGMANPLGPGIYEYVWQLTFESNVASTVTEWQPPNPAEPFGMVVVGGILASAVVLILRRRAVTLVEVALFGATTYLAADAVRSLFWWVAPAMMIVPVHLTALLQPGEWRDSETTTLQGAAHALVIVGVSGAALLVHPGLPGFELRTEVVETMVRVEGEGRGLLSRRHPTELVDRLAEEGSGRIFHDQAVGGMLEYLLGAADPTDPRPVAFVDQRMELVPPEVWSEYFTISAAEAGWEQLLRDREIDTLLLSPDEQWPLIQALQADPDWRLVGIDRAHLLFRRAR